MQFNPGKPLPEPCTLCPILRIGDDGGVVKAREGRLDEARLATLIVVGPLRGRQAPGGERWVLEPKPGWRIDPGLRKETLDRPKP